MKENQAKSRNNVLHRIFASTFTWIIISLIVVDFVLPIANPLQYVKNYDYMPLNQNPIVSKIPKFLTSNSNPDLIVMGSSLPMMAIAHCDNYFKKAIDSKNLDKVRPYPKALYLTDKLNGTLNNKQLKTYNLTISGCMASDIELLIEKTLRFGKTPKIIVYGIGPRSFIDNTVSKTEKTAIWQLVSKLKSLKDLLNIKNSVEDNRDIFLSSFSNFYRTKSDYQSFLVGYTCSKLDRSPTIFAAQQKEMVKKALANASTKDQNLEAVPPSKESLVKRMGAKLSDIKTDGHENPDVLRQDLALYDLRYNPPDYKQFDSQMSHFEKVLKTCQSNNIKLLVVAMPITDQNKALLDKSLYNQYLTKIPAVTAKLGGEFINLDDGTTYDITDFEDSVHTNKKGGTKVNNRLAETIIKSNWL